MSYSAGDLIGGKYEVKSTLDARGPASRYLATYQQQGMSVVVQMVGLDGLSPTERNELAQSLSQHRVFVTRTSFRVLVSVKNGLWLPRREGFRQSLTRRTLGTSALGGTAL